MNESQKRKKRFNSIASNAGQTLLKNRTQNWFFTGKAVSFAITTMHR